MSLSALCDNAPGARSAKVRLRELALEHVGSRMASVLDAFCGAGDMFDAVWSVASQYAGCDQRDWDFTGPQRFVCDNVTLLRSIDLQRFNIFDLDAYGSPWKAAAIIAVRRQWADGERGALVLTDGSSMSTRYGVQISGIPVSRGAMGLAASREAERAALASWISRATVRPVKVHRAQGNGSGRGSQRMTYTAVLFEGQPSIGS